MDSRRRLRFRRASALLVALALIVVGAAPSFAGSRDITVKRRNTYDQHVREREAKERREKWEAERQARDEARARRNQESKERRLNGGLTDDEIELQSFGTRTLGGACMYGPRGEVIHRPPGARCRGDAAPALAGPTPRAERGQPPLVEIEPPAEGPQPPAAGAPGEPRADAPEQTRPKPSASKMAPRTDTVLAPNERRRARRERCVWMNGRIAFQPEGVDCYAR